MRNRDFGVRRSDRPHLTGTRTRRSIDEGNRRAGASVREVIYIGPAGGGIEHLVRQPGAEQPFRVKAPANFRALPRAMVAVGQHAGSGDPFILSPGALPDPGQRQRSEREVAFPSGDPAILSFTPASATFSIGSGGGSVTANCRDASTSHEVYTYQKVGGSWLFRGVGEEARAFILDSYVSPTELSLDMGSEGASPGDVFEFKATLVVEGADGEPPDFESELSVGTFTVTWIA